MTKRKAPPPPWFSTLARWQQVGTFLLVAAAMGSGVTWFERQYGLTAQTMGWLRQWDMDRHIRTHRETDDKVLLQLRDMDNWRTYSDIKALRWQLATTEQKIKDKRDVTPADTQQLADMKFQLQLLERKYAKSQDGLKVPTP